MHDAQCHFQTHYLKEGHRIQMNRITSDSNGGHELNTCGCEISMGQDGTSWFALDGSCGDNHEGILLHDHILDREILRSHLPVSFLQGHTQ
jgi:hypothetical protein